MHARISRELLIRTASAVLIAPFFLLVYYLGGPTLLALSLILAVGVSWEFYHIAESAGFAASKPVGLTAAVLFLLAAALLPDARWIVVIVLLASTPAWAAWNVRPDRNSLSGWALTIAGFIYSAGLLQCFFLLRDRPNGLELGLMAILGTWATDSFAYLIGKNFGKHKFSPLISPNKTWEGTIGGVILGFVVIVIIGYLARLGFLQSSAIGLTVPIFSIFGDLTESFFKRCAGVKDAGNLIPGHGGLLDRMDSLLFSIAGVYFISALFF